ncbi:hypothetical protein NW841_00520 [Synechococcus sp. H60.3]|uniref:hypothetical protein n=1 Tax=Synechococcus sp. H60.3 TaxID=2967124 RepID=UPI0039C09C13
MKLFFPRPLGLSLALLLGAVAPVQAQRIVIDGRGIVVEPSTGGSVILNPDQPLLAPFPPGGVPFSIDAEGQVVSAPGYRCSATTAADNSPIICRSQFNPNDVVVYERDGRSNTFFVNTDNTGIRPSGSGLRILPNSEPVQPSGSGLRILLN